jgi:hypothetical protein
MLAALSVLPATPASGQQARAGDAEPVVLAGVGGLRWDDLDPTRTPQLWALAAEGALGSMSVRTTASYTCPADGWLTVGAGRRATAPREDPGELPDGVGWPTCPPLPEPEPVVGETAATIPGWADYQDANADERYDARLGLLGDALASAGACATAVGRGAGLATADGSGTVAHYVPLLAGLTPADLTTCPVTLVDLGAVVSPGFTTVPVEEDAGRAAAEAAAERAADAGRTLAADLPPREAQVASVDARVGRLRALLPPGATLLLATVADSSRRPHLGVAVGTGPGYGEGWLVTASTRRTALLQLTDVLPTLLALAAVPRAPTSIGQPVTMGGVRPEPSPAVGALVDQDTAAVVTGQLLAPFTGFLVVSQLLLYGTAAVALRRRWGGPAFRTRVQTAVRAVALCFAALPVASYLAGLVPWWRQDRPVAAMVAAIGVAAAGVAGAALLGPWRRHLLGPVTAVALTTALVLTVDVAAGSPLQLNALLGYSPLVAGRFYGFGNIAFALFATSAILATAGLTSRLVQIGRRRAAGLAAAAVGVVAVVVNGSDSLGTDFGGVIALVPGFTVLALGLAGIRVTPLRLAASVAGGGLAIAALSTLDWLRPAEDRSHLGRFVQQVLDGEAPMVVRRKLEANLDLLLGTPFGLIVPAAILFLVFVLMRPLQWRAAALERAYSRAPALRPGLTGVATALVVGFAVNDSGIVIPAVGLAIAVPLALAASVTALERDELEGVAVGPGGLPGPATPTSGPGPRGPARTRA